jgi:AcrR family transcriptional regulator
MICGDILASYRIDSFSNSLIGWSISHALVPLGTTLDKTQELGESFMTRNFFLCRQAKPKPLLWYYTVPTVRERVMATASMSKRRQKGDDTAVRERILAAAFVAFMKSGYATASMIEIATRARVSKRELYALVGNKQEMLIACISERSKRLDVPADLPVLRDREILEQVLISFGTKFVRDVSDPTVIAVFRLAIGEAVQAPEVARALNSIGRETSRAALRKIMARAEASGLLPGRPAELAEQFAGLLWRDLMVSLLLGVVERPNPREIAGRARDAAAAFLQLHPLPNDGQTGM